MMPIAEAWLLSMGRAEIVTSALFCWCVLSISRKSMR